MKFPLLLALALGSTAPAAFGQLTITFEELGPQPDHFGATTPLRNQIAGASFAGPSALDGGAILNQSGGFGVNARSGQQFLAFNRTTSMSNGGLARDPEEITFAQPWSDVSIWAAGGLNPDTLTMTAYDASNVQVGSAQVYSQGWAELHVHGTGIVRIVLVESGDDAWVYDDLTLSGPFTPFCAGDGGLAFCPCFNLGTTGRGCENSALTGGAQLSYMGYPSLSADTALLTSSGELPTALSILLQGTTSIAPQNFGDGLRCVGGSLKRLFSLNASAGVMSAPPQGGPSISARSAALGDVITAGTSRYYQTYYRDPDPAFCPNPPGDTWNVSSGLSVVWEP